MSTKKAKKQTHVLKIKKVPKVLLDYPVEKLAQPDSFTPETTVPEPVVELVKALQKEEVAEIHFTEPTTWQKFKNWFGGE